MAAFLILIAAGCEKQKTDPEKSASFPEAFTSVIEVKHGENVMTAKFTQTSFRNAKIKILTPESLAPLEMSFTDEKCSVRFNSLEFETDSARFPQAEQCSVIIQTLAYIGTGIDIEKTSENGETCYRGSSEHGVFALYQNPGNGKIKKLEISSSGLEVIFKEFEIT